MQDKIQEIMGLVDEYAKMVPNIYGAPEFRAQIESKLRELVREPLSDDEAWAIAVNSDNSLHAIRYAERAHGITKEGGE
jgi:hypothetical protein